MEFEQSQTLRRYELGRLDDSQLETDRGLLQKFFVDGMRDGVMYEDKYPVKLRSRHGRLPGNVSSWNAFHVERWIDRHKSCFGEEDAEYYKRVFAVFTINGTHLTRLDKQDLEDIGIAPKHLHVMLDLLRPLRLQLVSLQEQERRVQRLGDRGVLAPRREEVERRLAARKEGSTALWEATAAETRLQQYWKGVLQNRTIEVRRGEEE
eukprot:766754-Hanusia_phi.AAC.6